MGGTYLSIDSFTVTKSQPANNFAGDAESNLVRFTITDTANLLTVNKMIRAVLCDAVQQWLDAEAADLLLNGNAALGLSGADERYIGDGFPGFRFKWSDKACEIALVSLTSISSTGTLTVARPYADTV